MKKLIGSDIGSYLFDPAAKTITLLDIPLIDLSNVLVITNVTAGVMIYNFADAALGGVVVNNVLTLEFDTVAQNYSDILQIWIDLPSTEASGATLQQINVDGTQLWQDPITGALYTQDQSLERVLGTQSVTDGDSINAQVKLRRFPRVTGTIIGLNSELKTSCRGANTVAIQLAGTWAGTVSFFGSIDGGNFVACQASPLAGGIAVTTTTAVGAWVINCSGFDAVKIVWTTYTSGSVMATLVPDVAAPPPPNVAFPTTQVTTSTSLDAAFSSTALYVPSHAELGQQIVAPIVNPTQPTTYVANEYSRFPQTFRRLRVQSGGDKNLPFAQEMTTNRILVSNPEDYSMLEQILLQLKVLNNMYQQVNQCQPPPFWEELK